MVDGVLWSDAERIRQGLNCQVVGMSEIKHRRLEELDVKSQPGTKVGQYVPFYFCFGSIMLYLLYQEIPRNLRLAVDNDRSFTSRLISTLPSNGRTTPEGAGRSAMETRGRGIRRSSVTFASWASAIGTLSRPRIGETLS